jgi:tetratricopeptide (TPR) repeat protein
LITIVSLLRCETVSQSAQSQRCHAEQREASSIFRRLQISDSSAKPQDDIVAQFLCGKGNGWWLDEASFSSLSDKNIRPMNYNFIGEEDALAALKGEDRTQAAAAEAYLWSVWCRAGDAETDRVFRAGIEAMQRGNMRDAENMFSRVIDRAPDFAEGWNKRATARFMMKDFLESIEDCQETIARNPNHFGACSGQGLCHMSLGQFREAAICFRRALEIHPHLNAVRHNLTIAEAEGSEDNGQLH